MRRLLALAMLFLLIACPRPGLAGEPLSIARAVEMAVEYSPLLKAMTAGERAAREQVGAAQAMSRPKISLSATDSRLNSPLRVFGTKLEQQRVTMADFDPNRLNHPDYENNLQVGMQILQPLSLGGIDRHAVAAARQGEQASRLDTELAKQQTIFRTIEAYLQVVLARESVAVAEKAVEASRESVRNASAAFEAMQAVEADLLQAKVHHAQNEETLLRYHNQYRLAREGLATMLGVPSADGFDLTMPFLEQVCETCQQDPQDLLKEALANRPDYLKLERDYQALLHRERMARGKTRPHLAVGAQFEHNRRDLSQDGHGHTMVFARADWNLVDGGEARHQASEARSQAERLAKMREATADRIFLEIREAVFTINNALTRIQVSREAIRQSEEALRILRHRYVAGLAIVSDLLGAETSLLSHRMNHLQALYDYSISRARLKLALGELTVEKCALLHRAATAEPTPESAPMPTAAASRP